MRLTNQPGRLGSLGMLIRDPAAQISRVLYALDGSYSVRLCMCVNT